MNDKYLIFYKLNERIRCSLRERLSAAQGHVAGGIFSLLCVQKVLQLYTCPPPFTRFALFAVHVPPYVFRYEGRMILHVAASADNRVSLYV